MRSTAIVTFVELALLLGAAAFLHLSPPVTFVGLAAAEQPAQTGVVEGIVAYDRDPKRPWRYERHYIKDRKQGYLAEAVVALVPAAEQKAPASPRDRVATHVIDQKDFFFSPETLAIRVGDRVKFTNSDGVLHNVHSPSRTHRFDVNLLQGNENVQTFNVAGGVDEPVRLRCIFHGSMQAWIYVFDHPHFQVTERNGRFRLAGVPPGKYDLVVVHPAGELKSVQPITVQAGKTIGADVRVSPDDKVESKRE
jgi:plastocyanin